jgi:hypothetical protein
VQVAAGFLGAFTLIFSNQRLIATSKAHKQRYPLDFGKSIPL